MSGFQKNASRTRSQGKRNLSNAKKMEQIGQMDPENCLKCFVSAAKQYSNKKSDSSLRSLLKQLDIILSVKFTLDSFDPRSLLVSDSIINLIELLNEETPNNSGFKEKIILFFDILAREQPLLLNVMQDIFNLSFAFETFLSGRIDDRESSVFQQTLNLLEIITRNGSVELSNGISDDLLLFIIKNILSSDSSLLIPCLKLLANLCRHSNRVLRRVKSLETYTSFCKTLMSMVKKDSVLSVSSLSLFAALMSDDDPLGEKLMSPTVIEETIQILFNIFGKESSNEDIFSTAINLFLNLLENPKVVNRLEKYKYLNTCLVYILDKILPVVTVKSATKIIQFFNSLTKLESAESIVQLIFLREVEVDNSSLIALAVERISVDIEQIEPSLIALDFLINTFKFVIPPAAPVDLGDLISLFTTNSVKILTQPFDADKLMTKWRCQQISQIFSALTTEPLYKEKIMEQIELNFCQHIIDIQFVNNVLQPDKRCSATDWGENGVDVVLNIINFSSCLAEDSPEYKEFITLTLQDWRLIPFLAFSLSSASKNKVQLAFKIIQKGIVSNSISFDRLSEMLALNFSKLKQNALNTDSVEHNTNTYKVVCPSSPQKNNKNSQKVDDLIEKMETGLKVSDIKASEIMEMYEYKIESFTIKEKHLHELLDAKSSALQQLERILSQYRCRWAQSDAEALNLRRLLQEAEKKSEAAKEQTTIALLQQQEIKREHEQVLDELNKNRDEILDERNEFLDRLENAGDTITTLNKEMERKDEIIKLLQQHIDDHRQNETVLSNKLKDLEKVKKQLTAQLKEKEVELNDNVKNLKKLKENLMDQSEQLKEQEKQISKLTSKVESLELEKCSLQEEIISVENTNADLDRQLKENDIKYQQKCEELKKQTSITALIQNITSGRVDISLLEEKK